MTVISWKSASRAVAVALALLGAVATGCSGSGAGATAEPVHFRVTLENVSAPLVTSAGEVDAAYAPGLWVLHEAAEPIFSVGELDRGLGLEALAEDGNPNPLLDALGEQRTDNPALLEVSRFELPASEYEAGVLRPGASYVFEFDAAPGHYLSFAGMYAQSNDVFFATAAGGMALFDAEGAARDGDFTDELALYDTGSEVNEPPGEGAHQAPRQSGPGEGTEEDGLVRALDDGYDYPLPFVRATLEVLPGGV